MAVVARLRVERRVSILARPEGRALPPRPRSGRRAAPRFNPRPARRPGAPSEAEIRTPCSTPFQSSPGPKAGRSQALGPCASQMITFQSSPGPKAGRSAAFASVSVSEGPSFNPRPARRPGAPQVRRMRLTTLYRVSILARPEGRALPESALEILIGAWGFQSSPGPKAGRSATGATSAETGYWTFQSSPGPKAGRSSAGVYTWRVRVLGFQSSPGPKAGRSAARMSASLGMPGFQSSPGPKAGRSPSVTFRWVAPGQFQSSPGPKAGRSRHRGGRIPRRAPGFNPRPARRPGAPIERPAAYVVSLLFQSSPGPKAGRSAEVGHRGERRPAVSILARPEGRALRPSPAAPGPRSPRCFNPRPARRPGAPPERACRQCWRSPGFNPRPARRPGAPRLRRGDPHLVRVSILARPEGRALPAGSCGGCHTRPSCFNPRPARRPGAPSFPVLRLRSPAERFNPRPARRPGAPSAEGTLSEATGAFQSSPGPKAGRSWSWMSVDASPSQGFQSSPGPKAGRSSSFGPTSPLISFSFQSSPGPKAGRSSGLPTRWGPPPSILAGARPFAAQ